MCSDGSTLLPANLDYNIILYSDMLFLSVKEL